ncbi:hypothetical protein [Pseudoroseomonas ludipueritiae]|uniref:hypothetical protein n=1 Tax=Pseudoroseomonas ludipueritiae TaxID=198093 RepID=UPI0034621389
MLFFAVGTGVRLSDQPAGSLRRDMRNAGLEPLTARTRHIGLVATVSTTDDEPFLIARKHASIDRTNGGRSGWSIVTS